MWKSPTPVELANLRLSAFLADSDNVAMLNKTRPQGWDLTNYALRYLRIEAAMEAIRAMTGTIVLTGTGEISRVKEGEENNKIKKEINDDAR